MSAMEIVLLIVGAIIFIAGYFVPVKKEELQKETKEQLDKEIKEMVSNEMESVKEKVDNIVDETITFAVEKTERSIEQVTNGNIMAVKEYSDSVLEGINKNHKEVLFMYDMLSEKQEALKEVIIQADEATKSVVSSISSSADNSINAGNAKLQEVELHLSQARELAMDNALKELLAEKKQEETIEDVPVPEVAIQFAQEDMSERNQNEYILELKKAGKSNVAIAKELGLGVGEVKLVIDLFEGTDSERKK